MKITRTTFLRISALLLIGVALAAYVFNFKRAVRSILGSDTSQFDFKQDDAINMFMEDADKEDYWRQFSLAKRMFICVEHFFYSFGIHAPYYGKYLQYRSQITGQFLLSTDLFIDMSKIKISYVIFFNQYKAPCANPFSAIRYPETA